MRGQSRQAAAASFDSGRGGRKEGVGGAGVEGLRRATVSRGAGWLVGGMGVSPAGGGGGRSNEERRLFPVAHRKELWVNPHLGVSPPPNFGLSSRNKKKQARAASVSFLLQYV